MRLSCGFVPSSELNLLFASGRNASLFAGRHSPPHRFTAQARNTHTSSTDTDITDPSPPAPSPTPPPPPPLKPRRSRKPRSAAAIAPPPPIISPGSQHHHDLPSFLAYAARTALAPTTTVYRGTHYEYTAAAALSRLGFTLTRVGRCDDQGIDLLGHWSTPASPAPVRVVAQCKATAPKASAVRELEGSVASAPAGWRGRSTIALLAASKKATSGVRAALARSAVPMAFLWVDAEHAHVRQFVWNAAAVDSCGLQALSVGVKLPHNVVVLVHDGEPWSPPPIHGPQSASQKSPTGYG